MRFPVEFHLDTYVISLHAITESLGIFIGFRYFLWLRKKQGDSIPDANRVWIIIGAIFGALLGSRLLGAFEQPVDWWNATSRWAYFYQNKTVVGGFLGGLFGVELIKKIIGEKKSSGDVFVFPMILALIIGRIGCFSAGVYEETYGLPTNSFFGMNLGDGQLRHPVNLYEIAFLICLWVVLFQIKKQRKLENGSLFKLFMIAYVSFRFLLDFIKPHYTYIIGLSSIQIVCLIGVFYYFSFIFNLQSKPNHA